MSSLKYKDENGVWRKVGLGRNVSSVNGKYGDVAITAAELGAAPNELTDETASALGLNNGASVDNALAKLSNAAFIQRKFQKVTDASQLPVGSVIKLNVDSTPTEFIVVHQGNPDPALYDASCDGTWLLAKDAYYGPAKWTDGTRETYAESIVHNDLVNWFYPLFDDAAKSVIQEAKIPYCTDSPGTVVATGADGVTAKAFLLSASEVSQSHSNAVDGACLTYFADVTNADTSKRKAYKNGSAVTWWLRSVSSSSYPYALTVPANGTLAQADKTNTSTAYWRPAVIIKGDISGLGIYTNGEELTNDEALGNSVGLFDALGVPADLGGAKIETGTYTGTGTYGSSNPTMLTFSNAPSAVMIFKTGMYATNVGKGGIYTFLTGADNSATDFAVLGIDMNSIETSYQSGSLSYDTSNTSGTKIKKSEDGKTLYMYHPNYAASQMNATMVYYYITIV